MEQRLQTALLRVLEERKVRRIGGRDDIPIEVTVIATTNRNLSEAVEKGLFRTDLFYRLSAFYIHIPPLRERKEDIPLLVEFFMTMYCRELKTQPKDISGAALDVLMAYPWKGNVRELENCIERAIILIEGSTVMEEHITLNRQMTADAAVRNLPMTGALEDVSREAVRIVEKERISRALKETKGNKSRAAETLQVSYKTLLTKIKEYGIET